SSKVTTRSSTPKAETRRPARTSGSTPTTPGSTRRPGDDGDGRVHLGVRIHAGRVEAQAHDGLERAGLLTRPPRRRARTQSVASVRDDAVELEARPGAIVQPSSEGSASHALVSPNLGVGSHGVEGARSSTPASLATTR